MTVRQLLSPTNPYPAKDQINIEIDQKGLKKFNEPQSLSLIIDEPQSWSTHLETKSKKISLAVDTFKGLRTFITTGTVTQIYLGHIQPYFDYRSSAWNGHNMR